MLADDEDKTVAWNTLVYIKHALKAVPETNRLSFDGLPPSSFEWLALRQFWTWNLSSATGFVQRQVICLPANWFTSNVIRATYKTLCVIRFFCFGWISLKKPHRVRFFYCTTGYANYNLFMNLIFASIWMLWLKRPLWMAIVENIVCVCILHIWLNYQRI